MTTDELNAIVKAVMDELEKAGVDFDFKAETPQADDLVYVMRGTADKYQGITVKWQNLLGIIVQKATEARDDAITAKDIALQTLATIQGIESNVSSMKSSVETMTNNVSSMKASVEASESNVTQMKSDVSEMKTSVEGTKTEVENIKEETAGLLDTKINKTDALTYEEIMASTDLTNKVASASAVKHLKPITGKVSKSSVSYGTKLAYVEGISVTIPANCIYGINASINWITNKPLTIMLSQSKQVANPNNNGSASNNGSDSKINCSVTNFTTTETTYYVWVQCAEEGGITNINIDYWYIQL